MTKSAVSIITPIYNGRKYINKCLKSILKQNYKNKTWLICDDASNDNSYTIVFNLFTNIKQEFEDKEGNRVIVGLIGSLPAILIGFSKNRKQAAARNACIRNSFQFTDYYLTLDIDDIIFENKINKSIEITKNDNRIGLVYSDAIIYNEIVGTYIHEFRRPFDRKILEQENIISNCSLFSKKALESIGLYDEELSPTEDYDLWLRITERFAAVHIPEPLHQYTINNFSCNALISNKIWTEKRNLTIQKMIERKNNNYTSAR